MSKPRSAPLPEEVANYKGLWVAVYEGHVVAAADSATGAKSKALDAGVTDPTIFRVPTDPARVGLL